MVMVRVSHINLHRNPTKSTLQDRASAPGTRRDPLSRAIMARLRALWEDDFVRQGVNAAGGPQNVRASLANRDYALCSTYPNTIFVPSAVDDDHLRDVAAFRSRGRIPILSWQHRESGRALWRCSQPLVGKSNSRSRRPVAAPS